MLESEPPLSIRPNLDRIEELLGELVESLATPLTAKMLARLEAGEDVDLGAIKLTPEGIEHGATLVEWSMAGVGSYEGSSHDRIGDFSTSTDTFCTGSIEVPTGDILNYPFLEAVTKVMEERAEQDEELRHVPGLNPELRAELAPLLAEFLVQVPALIPDGTTTPMLTANPPVSGGTPDVWLIDPSSGAALQCGPEIAALAARFFEVNERFGRSLPQLSLGFEREGGGWVVVDNTVMM